LVKRVILESGSAVHSFAYNEDNFDVATELATRLTNATVHSRDEMGRLFMELPGLQILTAAVAIAAERLNALGKR
ncbi:Glutamyl-tRNA reductase, partial [Frankliniella fusca]